MIFDEEALRRPEFDLARSVPVVMSNGQTFHLPKPLVAVRPLFGDGQVKSHWAIWSYNEELDDLIERIAAERNPIDQVVLTIGLAAKLVLRNYAAPDHVMAQILVYRLGDPQSAELLKTVMEIATGQSGPKASGGGDGSA